MTSANVRRAPKGLFYFIDAALVLLFAVLGRNSHGEDLSAGGVFSTVWPFLVALLVSWISLEMLKKDPRRVWAAGVVVWLVTVAGGLALRVLSGSTAEFPFIIVATIVLGVFLIGHRLITSLFARRGERTADAAESLLAEDSSSR
ncbi:DUF3054 domain-containing protein [Pseudoclavibacter alba]|uniref:DUF3054 domain-containing protein n=1 Tax=Pseudoclavibacter albus TaxID=272241 RepID=A0ABT2HY34_9MICO|nr:DUF3054 domain-containing protein [Pseudoclavibacter alba]MCT2043236.1 DUF3054 domain-containing protein [Pseudoclavibacter alba]